MLKYFLNRCRDNEIKNSNVITQSAFTRAHNKQVSVHNYINVHNVGIVSLIRNSMRRIKERTSEKSVNNNVKSKRSFKIHIFVIHIYNIYYTTLSRF